MNETTLYIYSNDFLCSNTQEQVEDNMLIIISISIFSLIGVLSIIGNTLVLLVYRQSPRIFCGCSFTTYPQRTPRYRNGLQHNQRKLLIALAVVDLLTTIFVLPSDIGLKVFTLLNLRIYCDINNNIFVYALIDNARNIMFSLEGSILTSIAIDRFMVIGCPYIKTKRSKWWTCSSGASELSSSQISCADLQSKFSPTYASEDTHFSLAVTPHEDFDPPRKSNRLEERVSTSRTSKNLGRQLCVLLPITLTTLVVTFFEVSVLLLHIKQRDSVDGIQPAVKLRYFVNRLYLISTLITFPLVCGPYICVFLAIRSYDKKRARLHKGRSNQPKRSLRTAMTLFIATLVFYLTLLPVLIFHFGNWTTNTGSNADLAKDAHMHPSAVYIHHEFYYINNAVNFFIYSWVSPAFRRRLKDLCRTH